MDLLAGLSGLKTASELTTRIREALGSRDVKLDEVVARIIEIQGLISDGRTSLIDVQEQLLEKNREISKLVQQNSNLTAQLAKKSQGRKHDGAAWKVLEDGTEDGPYCPNCWEKTGIFMQPVLEMTHDGICVQRCGEHGGRNDYFYFDVPARLCKR